MAPIDRDQLQRDSEDLARLWRDKGADSTEWAESPARTRIEQQLQAADDKTRGTMLAHFLFAGHVARQEHTAQFERDATAAKELRMRDETEADREAEAG